MEKKKKSHVGDNRDDRDSLSQLERFFDRLFGFSALQNDDVLCFSLLLNLIGPNSYIGPIVNNAYISLAQPG